MGIDVLQDPTALASAVRDAAGGEDCECHILYCFKMWCMGTAPLSSEMIGDLYLSSHETLRHMGPVALNNALLNSNLFSFCSAAFNATAFLQSVGKGKPVSAIVEAVINGSMLRVTLLPSLVSATIQLCGAQAPSTGKRAAADAPAPAPSANGAPPTAAAIAAMPAAQAGAGNAEPFSVESKYLTESRTLNRYPTGCSHAHAIRKTKECHVRRILKNNPLPYFPVLHRDVTLVVEGVDKYNNLFASLLLPPASADGPSESMAELLVKDGLAKVNAMRE